MLLAQQLAGQAHDGGGFPSALERREGSREDVRRRGEGRDPSYETHRRARKQHVRHVPVLSHHLQAVDGFRVAYHLTRERTKAFVSCVHGPRRHNEMHGKI